AATATTTGLPIMAGPFESENEYLRLIPTDKKLNPEWVRSLFARGEAEVYSDDQLKYVGMPIGGIGCGQLYLSGDGRLWLWDIFKSNYRREPDHGQRIEAFTLGGHYAKPIAFGEQYTRWNGADVQQGFLLRVKDGDRLTTRTLDRVGFPRVTFRGEYPIGKVSYKDDELPVEVSLEAFSPFIPLNAKDSALPATVLSYTVSNTSQRAVEVDLAGWMQNATCPYTRDASLGQRRNRVVQAEGRVTLLSTIEPPANGDGVRKNRADIVFADFESDDWGSWNADGEAFEGGPFPVASRQDYQDLAGYNGERMVNSHNTRIKAESTQADNLTGTLTSPAFTVERNFVNLSIAGGGRGSDVYLEVLVDSKQVGKVTGHNSNAMRGVSIDLSRYEGQEAQIRIVDSAQGGWGNIQADQIVFSDRRATERGLKDKHGYGSTTLTLLHGADESGITLSGAASMTDPDSRAGLFGQMEELTQDAQVKPLDELLVGALATKFKLPPGESRTIDFAITWYFPDYQEIDAAPGQLSRTPGFRELKRHYAPWFNSAGEVADYLTTNKDRLLGDTRQWNETWYDSTLPFWLLDRSFISLDCVATQMFHWFDTGRPWGWEGVDCCPGTCTHVWHYAQGLSRIFPEIERAFREIVDYEAGFDPSTGRISDRGDYHQHEATDGQAGSILRVYREHQISSDDAFLKRLWPRVKQSIEFLITKDGDGSGLIEGGQPHTLDAAWYGPMAWVSGLYLAALAAGEAMADEMGDNAFARQCREILDRGQRNIVDKLFNGEYFIHLPDPNHPQALRTGKGCHIDQVLGQSWTHQVGLGRVMPKKETVSALNSLWKYNFAPDAGRYAVEHVQIEKAFRWYAMPGEAGLLMCTWPKGGAEEAIPGDQLRPSKNPEVWTGPGGYFNECMNGFEYQVAWHMIAEGNPEDELVKQGLAITKAIHERYGTERRNPYNEIECSDHYARSMASYGIFLAVCGFEYHGPQGHIGFAPRMTPENFKAPFTAATGWGSYEQRVKNGTFFATLEVKWGWLSLESFAVRLPNELRDGQLVVMHDRQAVHSSTQHSDVRATALFKRRTIQTGQTLELRLKIT
ncbi:MAG: GH116 family glycosyl-hydrolase, partial [Aeoliella sp.]